MLLSFTETYLEISLQEIILSIVLDLPILKKYNSAGKNLGIVFILDYI